MVGRTLNHYEILEPLGAGGMGEVYLAEDTSLDRQVALKVLPSDLAADPERRQRFEREAKAIAALDHPNIVVVHSVEEAEGIYFITMQLVGGKTLSELIPRNGFPLEKFFDLAIPLADAISSAHEQGIVHRDLKPANIMVSDDGRVRVLDFGLAKLKEEAAEVEGETELPTVGEPLTEEGKILGTVAYMSPEQAEGKPLDHRTDIFSLGIILYEMATGERPFKGDTKVSIMSSIVKEAPTSVTELNRDLPRHLGRIVKRALTKDVEHRFQSTKDLRNDLEELKEEILSGELVAGSVIAAAARPLWRRALPWGLMTLMAVIVGVAIWAPWSNPPSSPSMSRLNLDLPLNRSQRFPIVISPDGTRLVYWAREEGAAGQLYLHEFDTGDSKSIGSGMACAFSPDGRWLAFRRQGRLMRVELDGGAEPILLTASSQQDCSWGADDTIVFSPDSTSGLSRIPAIGGEPEVLTTLDVEAGDLNHRYPQVLPNGKGVIFTAVLGGPPDEWDIVVQSFETGVRRRLVKGSYARYVSTGHLVYVRRAQGAATFTTGTLYSCAFDIDTLQVVGPEIPVQENVYFYGDTTGGAIYAISDTGRLVYAQGLPNDRQLVLVDLDGNAEPIPAPPELYVTPRFCSDGQRLAIVLGTYPDRIDLYELEEQTRRILLGTYFTDREGIVWEFDHGLAWHPDGQRLAISALSPGSTWQVILVSLDQSVAAERLAPSPRSQTAQSWTTDGKLLYTSFTGNDDDIWQVTLDQDQSTSVLVEGDLAQAQPAVSRDMRLLAYVSTHTGQREVWVRPYGESGGAVQASIDGGEAPRWAPNGQDLYFRRGEQVLTVEVSMDPVLRAGALRELFSGPYLIERSSAGAYDLSPDGQHFVMILEGEKPGTRLEVVENWFEELKRMVPTER